MAVPTKMSLNESIFEDAALNWFGELVYEVGHGPQLALGVPAPERDSLGDVVLVARLHEAIWQQNAATPPRGIPTVIGTLLTEPLSGELSVSSLLKLPLYGLN
jgi:type I restriction enzyme R subunit